MRNDAKRKKAAEGLKKEDVQGMLEAHNGNISKAASELGVSRYALYRLMKGWGMYDRKTAPADVVTADRRLVQS
jgi:transcriptional regulator of acetoin/glycerol metabolism